MALSAAAAAFLQYTYEFFLEQNFCSAKSIPEKNWTCIKFTRYLFSSLVQSSKAACGGEFEKFF